MKAALRIIGFTTPSGTGTMCVGQVCVARVVAVVADVQ